MLFSKFVFRQKGKKFAQSEQSMEYNKTAVRSRVSVSNIITLHRFESKVSRGPHIGESHDFPELVYVESGVNNVMIDGVCTTLNEGEAVIFAPLSHHAGSDRNGAITLKIISFDLCSPLPDSICNRPLILTDKQRAVIDEIFSTGLELFTNVPPDSAERGMFFNGKGDDSSLQIIKNNLELLLLSLCEANSESAALSDDKAHVIGFLKKNVDKNFTLEEIAKASSMSVSRLKRLFDGGVINYFNEMKIAIASDMIRNGSKNFSQIAEELGFGSIHYFSRLFKAKTGKSPSEYKKS